MYLARALQGVAGIKHSGTARCGDGGRLSLLLLSLETLRGNHRRSAVDDGRVETLLADRADARRERNYRLADGIRDELFEMGVEMDDKQRTWWVVGGGNVRPHDYARADDDGGSFVDGAQLAEIDQLISERLAAKKERDFDTADRLQEQLRYLGVEMDDRERVWRYKYDGGRQY